MAWLVTASRVYRDLRRLNPPNSGKPELRGIHADCQRVLRFIMDRRVKPDDGDRQDPQADAAREVQGLQGGVIFYPSP